MSFDIDPRAARPLLDSGEAIALDVREADEWRHGHIRDALHIPLGQLGDRLHELPTGTRLVAVCRSGSRSSLVVEALRQRGYDAVNLAGGLLSWHGSRLPLEPAPGVVA